MRRTVAVVVVLVMLASIIVVYSEEVDLSSPLIETYPGFDLLAIPEDSIYSFRSGELYRAPFGGTGSLYSGTLTSALNELGIATLDDVQAAALTIPDLVSGLQQFFSSGGSYETSGGGFNLPQQLDRLKSTFGTYPYSYVRRSAGATAATTSANVASFGDLLARIGMDLQYDFTMAIGSNYLTESGTKSQTSSVYSVTTLMKSGFLGLGSILNGLKSTQFDMFAPGSGSSTQVTTLMDALSVMNTSNISALTYSNGTVLRPSGVTDSFTGQLSLAAIDAYGFQGLATILRGPSSNGSAISWMDYSDLTTSVSGYTNLFDLNAAGFEHLQNMFAQYMYSHGTDLDIRERENMQDQAEQFVEDFTSPGGKGTMSSGNMSDMANVSSSMGDNFSSSATVSDIFTQLGSGNNYSFFSNDVLNDLEGNVPATVSVFDDGYVDFLSPHLNEFREGVGSSW